VDGDPDPRGAFAGCLVRTLTGGALTIWGTELAGQMLAQAGFGHVELLDSRRPQNCIFGCWP
jgi:hypothetical protein